MPFSESQLETWSNQGATTSSATTYNSVKTCIEQINWKADVEFEIYLQGSYKNTTNIYGNSDVDVVIEFKSVFYSNKESFSAEERKAFDEVFSPGKYELAEFKEAILSGLSTYYGHENVREGNKAIRIKGTNGRLDADVVCCATFRKYNTFSKTNQHSYVEGITFWETSTGNQVINYPKRHYENGVTKNSACGSMYKPVTRVVKNIKARMISESKINGTTAPSYFIECLLYNVPSGTFLKSSYRQAMDSLIVELGRLNEERLRAFVCQNEQILLFGTSARQWNTVDCMIFLVSLIKFYNAG